MPNMSRASRGTLRSSTPVLRQQHGSRRFLRLQPLHSPPCWSRSAVDGAFVCRCRSRPGDAKDVGQFWMAWAITERRARSQDDCGGGRNPWSSDGRRSLRRREQWWRTKSCCGTPTCPWNHGTCARWTLALGACRSLIYRINTKAAEQASTQVSKHATCTHGRGHRNTRGATEQNRSKQPSLCWLQSGDSAIRLAVVANWPAAGFREPWCPQPPLPSS